MLEPRFCRHSDLRVWVVPVAAGEAAPKRKRAIRAGFGHQPGDMAEVMTRKHRRVLVRCGEDLEAASATGVSRVLRAPRVAVDARGWSAEAAARFAAGAVLRGWRFRKYVTRLQPGAPLLAELDVMVDDVGEARAAWEALAPGVAGALFARDLVVEPGNALTPALFSARLRRLEDEGLAVEVLDAARLSAEGFGGLLAVGRASANPPCLVVLRWAGTLRADPVVFVGKGITFDTGGVSIKPADRMWEMRADMAGAAACAGAMLALARRESASPAVAVLALAENAIGAASYRPGDVLRMASGTTVEVVDTDAEGRLVLADALAWAVRTLRPQAVIDLATLTGSIVTALGHEHAGLFSGSDVLAAHTAAAGAAVGERAWRMPLSDAYGEALESDIADMRHCTEGRLQPDACHAAHFLHTFVGDVPWVHLDIAGVEAREATTDRHGAGPSGWGARLLDRLVRDRFESSDRERP